MESFVEQKIKVSILQPFMYNGLLIADKSAAMLRCAFLFFLCGQMLSKTAVLTFK
jgi:hypothetical protein